MKKYIIIALFLFPLFSYASFSKDLYYGVRGDAEVQALQEFLTDRGHYTGAATGNFFALTLSAVKNFQIANGILPASGYFGPKTRAKANQILETAGVSADSVKNEDNAPVSAPVVASKTKDDIVASLASQIVLLQQQLATLQKNQDVLQQQNQSLQTIQQQQAAQTQQITQQTQTLQQIQANTTPSPAPAPTSPQPVTPPYQPFKEVRADDAMTCSSPVFFHGSCGLTARYLEDAQVKRASITVSSDDGGKFTACNCAPDGVGLGNNLEGNPLTANTYRSGYDGNQAVPFDYVPIITKEEASSTPEFVREGGPHATIEIPRIRLQRKIAITANGITKTITRTLLYYPFSQ